MFTAKGETCAKFLRKERVQCIRDTERTGQTGMQQMREDGRGVSGLTEEI